MIQLIKSPFARTSSPVSQHINQLNPVFFYRLQGTNSVNISDDSVNGYNATLIQNSKSQINPYDLFLDTQHNQYISIPSIGRLTGINLSGCTIMFWFNSQDITSRDIKYCLFSLSSAIQSNYPQNCIDIIKDVNSNNITCRVSNSVWGDVSSVVIADLLDNTWYHITLTINPTNSNIKLYLNGILLSTNTLANNLTAIDRTFCYLGKSCDNTISNSTMYAKDLALFNYPLCDTDILTTYNLSAYSEKISGIAKDSTYPFNPASVVLIRELPDGKTVKIIPDNSAYWEYYVTKDKVYEIVAYGPEGSKYKPEIVGPVEII